MKRKNGSITLKILEEIVRISEGIIMMAVDRREFHKRLWSDGYSYSRFVQKLKKLEAENIVNIKETPSGLSVELTSKGKIKLIENNQDSAVDGKWRMLSFDIPERYRNKRNQFRRSIKKLGFKQVQKSLWACPYVKADEVELIYKELMIDKYVAYLLVEKTDVDSFLSKIFPITQK